MMRFQPGGSAHARVFFPLRALPSTTAMPTKDVKQRALHRPRFDMSPVFGLEDDLLKTIENSMGWLMVPSLRETSVPDEL